VYSRGRPFLHDESKEAREAWVESLRRVGRLPVRRIVPGHGPICDKGAIAVGPPGLQVRQCEGGDTVSSMLGLAVKNRLRYLILAAPFVLSHALIHEGAHYFTALAYGERVLEVRFLTNGLGSSQVVYASPVTAPAGFHWLVIAWAPGVVTTAIGYVLYLKRARLRSNRMTAVCALYAGSLFLLLDPFYLSVLSLLVGGDIGAVQAVGWPAWPVRAFALLVFMINWRLTLGWIRELRGPPLERTTSASP
jgi:hypothetical protein